MMKLEKHYTCWLERRWHKSNKSFFARLATGLLESELNFDSKILMMVVEAVI